MKFLLLGRRRLWRKKRNDKGIKPPWSPYLSRLPKIDQYEPETQNSVLARRHGVKRSSKLQIWLDT
jgi:hypothetical protein